MVLVSKPKRSPSIHSKRRNGQHHRHTPDYHKTYWPYLPLAMIVGLGIFVNSLWPTLQNVLGYATNMSISGLLEATNEQRTTESLASLSINGQLNQAAQAKAEDMAARNYWSHETPDGTPPWAFFNKAGYSYEAAGENLAYGFDNSGAAVVAWMNSPGHRANIMNGQFQEVGFGIANVVNYQDNGEQTIVVAMYGDPAAVVAATPTQVTPIQKTDQVPAQSQEPSSSPDVVTANTDNKKVTDSKHVARIQLMTNGIAPWSMFAVSAVAAIAIGIFILRHGLFWRRALVRGEKFIIKHPLLDIALVGVAVLGFILTRSAGSIY